MGPRIITEVRGTEGAAAGDAQKLARNNGGLIVRPDP
jgi:hypothetical protein